MHKAFLDGYDDLNATSAVTQKLRKKKTVDSTVARVLAGSKI